MDDRKDPNNNVSIRIVYFHNAAYLIHLPTIQLAYKLKNLFMTQKGVTKCTEKPN